MAILTIKFRNFRTLGGREEVYNPPGIVGDVIVQISKQLVEFEQFGIAQVESLHGNEDATIAELLLGEGDPSVLTNVQTSRMGLIINCRKLAPVQIEPIQSADTGATVPKYYVSYVMRWRQVSL